MFLVSAPDDRENAASIAFFKHSGIALLLAALACICTGCSGMAPSSAPAASTPGSYAKIALSPSRVTIPSGSTQQFTATLTSTPNTAVEWKTTAGSITSTGLFTAPSVTSSTSITITATNVSTATPMASANGYGGGDNFSAPGIAISSSADVTVTPVGKLAISDQLPSAGTSGTPYSGSLAAVGGIGPYQWSISGTLPAGLSLNQNGVISGIPVTPGTYTFTALVKDGASKIATKTLTVTVDSSTAGGNFDGPAELPRIYIQSTLADTPASGSVTLVPQGGNLQTALDNASCGDTIQLQTGASFTGIFTFPAKSCTDSNWIIVRTSASDSALPPEGTRLTPCYAGVTSLPGRPSFNCGTSQNVTAKLVMSAVSGSGPIVFANGANHYRLIGLEVTRLQGTPVVTSLASIQPQGTMNNIVFDRLWMHGTAQDETTRGVELVGGTYISVVDSFFTDFHCISISGSCGDSQAILGGLGSNPMGPYQISDNFLEAAGENILFGGGAATLTPADVEISRNHMFKPLIWMKGQPGYVGGANGNPFVVKNLFELKNGQRFLLDSNIMEYSWGGFSQVGFGFLLTPRNQGNGLGGNLCPSCQVTDVTVRNSTISHVGAGMQIANPVDGTGVALAGERYSIHDVIIDDINGVAYNGPSEFAQVSVGTGAPALADVTINHVTAFPASTLLIVGAQSANTPEMSNFVFTNSIVNAGTYPVWSTGGGGSANCAAYDSPLTTFNACFSPYSVTSNAMIGTPSGFPPSKWPVGNYFPASVSVVQFVNYNGGNGGNYQLQASSPYKGAATDGKDLGADVSAVLADIAGVR